MIIHIKQRKLRVLDFDIENRPLHFIADGYTSDEPTVIACAWTDQPDDVFVFALSHKKGSLRTMLTCFMDFYMKADMVTGHFIRGHDLPIINGSLIECGMSALPEKLSQDTKLDLLTFKGLSKSQKNLAAMFDAHNEKKDMDQSMWRSANRLEPEGVLMAKERAESDVRQHMELRSDLLQRGLLKRPRVWRSGCSRIATYTP